MRILLFSLNFHPEELAIARYSSEMCDYFTTAGMDVNIIAGNPYYPEWKVRDGFNKLYYNQRIFRKSRVLHCPHYVPRRPSFLRRLIHYISYSISSFIGCVYLTLRFRPKLAIFVAPSIIANFPSAIFCRCLKIKCHIHVQDLEADAAVETNLITTPFYRTLAKLAQRFLFSPYTSVSTISEDMKEKMIISHYAKPSITVFPNWVNLNEITYTPPKKRDLTSPFKILYSGNIGEKQHIEIIFKLAEMLSDQPQFKFIIRGAGSRWSDVKKRAARASNIEALGLVPSERLNATLADADLHIISQVIGSEDSVMPSKLTNMLASGRPILHVGSKKSAVANAIKDCGTSVMPDDLNDAKVFLNRLFRDEHYYKTICENSRLYAENNLDQNRILKHFLLTIREEIL